MNMMLKLAIPALSCRFVRRWRLGGREGTYLCSTEENRDGHHRAVSQMTLPEDEKYKEHAKLHIFSGKIGRFGKSTYCDE